MEKSRLLSQGWSSYNDYSCTKNGDRAYLSEGVVSKVTGTVLERDGLTVFNNDTLIGAGREEISKALGLPLASVRAMRGNLLAPQCLWFKQLNLMIFFQGDRVRSLVLDGNFSWKSCRPTCQVTAPSSESGFLTSNVTVDESELIQVEGRPGHLALDDVWPGLGLERLVQMGWRRDPYQQNHYTRNQGRWIYADCGKVKSITGRILTCKSTSSEIKVGQKVSPEREEVFDALGLEPLQYKFQRGYEPANHLIYPQLGLQIWLTQKFDSATLTYPEGTCPDTISKIQIKADPKIRTKKYVFLKSP